MDDGQMGPAMALALALGMAVSFFLCVRLLVWVLSALISVVHMA